MRGRQQSPTMVAFVELRPMVWLGRQFVTEAASGAVPIVSHCWHGALRKRDTRPPVANSGGQAILGRADATSKPSQPAVALRRTAAIRCLLGCVHIG